MCLGECETLFVTPQLSDPLPLKPAILLTWRGLRGLEPTSRVPRASWAPPPSPVPSADLKLRKYHGGKSFQARTATRFEHGTSRRSLSFLFFFWTIFVIRRMLQKDEGAHVGYIYLHLMAECARPTPLNLRAPWKVLAADSGSAPRRRPGRRRARRPSTCCRPRLGAGTRPAADAPSAPRTWGRDSLQVVFVRKSVGSLANGRWL